MLCCFFFFFFLFSVPFVPRRTLFFFFAVHRWCVFGILSYFYSYCRCYSHLTFIGFFLFCPSLALLSSLLCIFFSCCSSLFVLFQLFLFVFLVVALAASFSLFELSFSYLKASLLHFDSLHFQYGLVSNCISPMLRCHTSTQPTQLPNTKTAHIPHSIIFNKSKSNEKIKLFTYWAGVFFYLMQCRLNVPSELNRFRQLTVALATSSPFRNFILFCASSNFAGFSESAFFCTQTN